ncbi:MAG: 3-keto-disaccharide hydrolase [Acidobacteriota bacterium]
MLIAAVYSISCFFFGLQPPASSLFDGQTLANWEITNFGGQGAVYVEDGALILERGDSMTGVTWSGGELPIVNYEIALEAARLSGNDFFCGLTFPVNESNCSLIIGGWGGGLVGLSSLDGADASENETMRVMSFREGQWYRIRLKVTEGRIEAWIEDEKVVDVATEGRQISIRPEVYLSQPLGFSTWVTTAALRNIRMKRLE